MLLVQHNPREAGTGEALNLAFLDTETTGLSAPTDKLLEVGVVIVELPTFKILEEAELQFCFDRQRYAGYIHPKVVDMHIANGLWDACEKSEYDDYQKMDADLASFLLANDCQGSQLAGANPSFDRSFLRHFLPQTEKLFHYRNFDTNSFWLLREFIEGRDSSRAKSCAHRAVADCKQAIETIEEFWTWFAQLTSNSA